MSEENETKEPNEETKEEYTETELQAMEKGWKPEDQWEGDKSDFISAGEFLRRGELIGKIISQNKEINEIRASLNNLIEHNKKISEIEYKKAIEDLKRAKIKALEEAEHEQVVEIDDQILEIKRHQEESNKTEQTVSPAFVTWSQENPWYNTNIEMREVADAIAKAYVQTNPSTTEQDVFNHVSMQIRKRYPESFEKKVVQTVESGSQRSKKQGAKFTRKDLNDFQRQVMDNFVKTGVMTEEQYIADLVKTGELKNA